MQKLLFKKLSLKALAHSILKVVTHDEVRFVKMNIVIEIDCKSESLFNVIQHKEVIIYYYFF